MERNRKSKILIWVIAVMTTVVMLAPVPAFAANGASVTKDETVYVIQDASGNAKKTIVSDFLKNTSGLSTISDSTDLSNIENVKGKEKFTKSGSSLSWAAAGNNIYYRGTTLRDTPITMSVKYYIDGEELTPKQIAGKSGDLEIKINYTNNERVGDVRVPFLVVSTMMLKDDNFSNVTIDNGKVIDDGDKQIVVGMTMPGMTQSLNLSSSDIDIPESLDIHADVKDFSLDTIVTVAANNLFDDLDTSSVSSLSDLDSAINKLDVSAQKLVSGSVKIAEGTKEAYSGSKKLASGSKTLASGTSDLSTGLGQLKTGSASFNSGITALQTGMNDMNTKLGSGIAQMSSGVSDMNKLMGSLSGSFTSAESTNTTAETYLNNLAQGMCRETMVQILTKYKTAPTTLTDTEKAFLGIYQALETSNGTLKVANDNMTASTFTNPSDGKTYNTLYYGVNAIGSGLSSMSSQASSGISQIQGGLTQLSTGAQQLSAGIENAYGGSVQLKTGADKLNTGANSLVKGEKTLVSGTSELSSGMSKFYDDGIAKIVKAYNGNVKGVAKRLQSMANASQDYTTFTKLSNNTKGTVKFLYRTDAIGE